MITTHLVVLSFFNGASTYVVPNPGNFAGYHSVGPYAFLTGFAPVNTPVADDAPDQLGGKRGDEETRHQVMKELAVVRARNRMARELGVQPDELPAISEPDYSLELILLLMEA